MTQAERPGKIVLEPIGKRIARLRAENGWTQQVLASRLAVSRVAVSHIEMDLTIPGERTITLLAGLFKMSPHELVEGSDYPRGKAERLPEMVCAYTRLELDLALLENDLEWLGRLSSDPGHPQRVQEVTRKWSGRLSTWKDSLFDEDARGQVAAAQGKLAGIQPPAPETQIQKIKTSEVR